MKLTKLQKEIMTQLTDKEYLGYISADGECNWNQQVLTFKTINSLQEKGLIFFEPRDDIFLAS